MKKTIKELEESVKKEEAELEKAKRDLAAAKKGKASEKKKIRKSKKEKQREIEASLKEVDLRAAMGELGIYERQPNPALYAKELIEKASLTELKKVQKAAKDFLEKEKKKEEERELKKAVAKQHLESLGLDLELLKELL